METVEVSTLPRGQAGSVPVENLTPEQLASQLLEIADQRKPGEPLLPAETELMRAGMALCIQDAPRRMRFQRITDEIGYHDTIKHLLADWFERLGLPCSEEIPFMAGGFAAEQVRFDLVVHTSPRPLVIEVKHKLDPRDLGQVGGYAKLLDGSGQEAMLAIGSLIENYPLFTTGRVGALVRELMERDNLGVVLADRFELLMLSNYKQLIFEEMPAFQISAEPVGMLRRL